MHTNRRDFLKCLGLGVVGLRLGLSAREARAEGNWNGRLLLYVHAGGGWDPTSFCDPKGRASEDAPDPVNHYAEGDIREENGLRWAPFGGNDAFFRRYGARLRIVNGLDTTTNGHESGTRYACSGALGDTHPALTALYAGAFAADRSMPFITNGAFDLTRGVVTRTRVGNLGALDRLADPADLGNGTRLFAEASFARIAQANEERSAARLAEPILPRERVARDRLLASRGADTGIGRLKSELPDLNTFASGLGKQGAMAIAAWRAGLTASAQLSIGGFDTHGNHDNNHANALTALTQGLDEILREIDRRGVADQVTLVVGSDFGRTPAYNEGNGKDHWPITSMVALGAGISGGRAVGGTTPDFRALPCNPATLDPLDEGAQGVVLTPAHVHRALRTVLGLTGSALDAQFPLNVEELPILG